MTLLAHEDLPVEDQLAVAEEILHRLILGGANTLLELGERTGKAPREIWLEACKEAGVVEHDPPVTIPAPSED